MEMIVSQRTIYNEIEVIISRTLVLLGEKINVGRKLL